MFMDLPSCKSGRIDRVNRGANGRDGDRKSGTAAEGQKNSRGNESI